MTKSSKFEQYSLANRMKKYEGTYQLTVQPRTPLILRIDGKAFHTLSRKLKLEKPFDLAFSICMDSVARTLMKEIQNTRMAYIQSDEINLLLVDYNRFDSEQWFIGNLQKIVSISASIASTAMTSFCSVAFAEQTFSMKTNPLFCFDSRALSLPEEEVGNYFLWRQQDWKRNAVMMVARCHFSHKQLMNVSGKEAKAMLEKVGVNFEKDYDEYWKYGRVLFRGEEAVQSFPFVGNREKIDSCLSREDQ